MAPSGKWNIARALGAIISTPAGAWRSSAGKYWEQILANFPQASCGEDDPVDCFSAEKFIKHVFMIAAQLAMLSFVPDCPKKPTFA